jgi:hypothetical protein
MPFFFFASNLHGFLQLPTDFSLVFVIIPTVIQSLEDKVTGPMFGSVSKNHFVWKPVASSAESVIFQIMVSISFLPKI